MDTEKQGSLKQFEFGPGFDEDFARVFGENVAPTVAEVFRCKVCGGYIYPFQSFYWSCSKDLCGPLIPKSDLEFRLMHARRYVGMTPWPVLMRVVAEKKPS